jgi:hypothetical protein
MAACAASAASSLTMVPASEGENPPEDIESETGGLDGYRSEDLEELPPRGEVCLWPITTGWLLDLMSAKSATIISAANPYCFEI